MNQSLAIENAWIALWFLSGCEELCAEVGDGEKEARLMALACSAPPEGRARWTLRLLEDKVVELEPPRHPDNAPRRDKVSRSRGR